MAYRLDPTSDPSEELRRIAGEQARKALHDLAGKSLREGVHEARKRFKKIRALLRLFGPHLGGHYESENVRFRDAGRLLAPIRDATSLIEVLNVLEKQSKTSFGPVGDGLARRREEMENESLSNGPLKEVRRTIRRALDDISTWSLDLGGDRFPKGFEKTYTRGCGAHRKTRKHATAERLHELRKRVKYHRYHCRLMEASWEAPLATREKEAHALTDLLGEHHDLSGLNHLLLGDPANFGGPEPVEKFLRCSGARCAELELHALDLGARLYAEKPKHLSRRMRRYWEIASLGSR